MATLATIERMESNCCALITVVFDVYIVEVSVVARKMSLLSSLSSVLSLLLER